MGVGGLPWALDTRYGGAVCGGWRVHFAGGGPEATQPGHHRPSLGAVGEDVAGSSDGARSWQLGWRQRQRRGQVPLCNGDPASAAGAAGGLGAFMGTECSGECSHGIAQEGAAKDSDCDLYVGVSFSLVFCCQTSSRSSV